MNRKQAFGELLLLCVSILVFDIRQAGSLYPPVTEWTQTYGTTTHSEEPWCLIQTDDRGYAVLGFARHWETGGSFTQDMWFVKTDAAGHLEWNRTYGAPLDQLEAGHCVVQTDDGGYILAGYNGTYVPYVWNADVWVIKTDATGLVQWNQTYGGSGNDVALCVIRTSDGGYAIAGYTTSLGAGGNDFWLIKIDATGTVMWNQTYGGVGSDVAVAVVQGSDGGYVIAGYTRSYGAGDDDFWLVKTDSAGNAQWNHTYGGADLDRALSMVATSDGGYALAGRTESFGGGYTDFWLVKTDAAGTMLWNHTYGGSQHDEAYSVVQARDGGYALLGRTNSFGACDYWLVKTDALGDVQWSQTYAKGTLSDIGYSVVQTDDYGYAMAGYSNYHITPDQPGSDFWLVKVCVGDVNGDGLINVVDLTIVSLAYGTFEGEPGYNLEADLNSDGIVDMKDMVVVARNLCKP